MIVTAGLGISSRASHLDVLDMLAELARAAGVLTFVGVGTLESKSGAPALVRGVEAFAPIRIEGFGAAELTGIPVHAPSRRLEATVGTPSVAEAAAICAARRLTGAARRAGDGSAPIPRPASLLGWPVPGAPAAIDMLVPKLVGRFVTGAVARATWVDQPQRGQAIGAAGMARY
ncbi:cobalamin biosynthesis protein [Lolliginicoccus levis]|uniref:cobalamin biosynthesis protein n=1 Tax=Lolliginicoccus levis TaxID=2919542 RepID=UPI00241ED61D|nr:cobalamin biosynthesis protein [Lolliginicoccus levis]